MPIEFAPPQSNVNYQIPPPQYTDPLQTLAQIGQLRTQGLQQQSAQQELQANQLKNQQAQEDFADQQKMRKVYSDWLQSGNTKTDDLVKQAAGAGVGPRTLMPLQQQLLEHRTKLATANELDFKNTVSKQAQTTQALNAVASSPPDQRPAAWQTERQNLITAGYASPGDIPEAYPGDQVFEELRHHNRTSEQELALVKEQREAAASAATTAGTQATTEETKLKTTAATRAQALAEIRSAPQDPNTGTPTPAAWQAILRNPQYKGLNLPGQPTKADINRLVESTIPEKDLPEYRIKQAEADAIKAYQATSPQDLEAQVDAIMPPSNPMNAPTKALLRTAISRGDFPAVQKIFKDAYDQIGRVQVAKETAANKLDVNLAGYSRQLGAGPGGGADSDLHGDEYLRTLPGSLAARVRGIATGNEALPTGRAAMSGPGAILANAVYQYDPEYTPLLGQQRKETLKEFNSTQPSHAGGQLLALNTVIHHADMYLDAAAALKNGIFKPGNEVYNKVATMFGAAPPTNAALLAQFFAGETGKVATGGVPAEGEIKGILKNMSTDGSPEAMEGAAKTLISIAAGKMIPLKERRDNAHLEKFVPILGPDAKAILQRRGFDPETMKPVAAGGGPAGTVAVPLKDGRIAYLTPAAAAKLKSEHPELVK